jgi:site-specific recombinase XerD
MIEQLFPSEKARKRLFTGPLAPHIEELANLLCVQGYARVSILTKLRLIAELSRSLLRRKLPITALNEILINRFLDRRRRRRYGNGSRATGKMLLRYLRECGRVPSPTKVVDHSPLTQLLQEYQQFLTSERGLSQATVDNYIPTVQRFLSERFDSSHMELEELSPQDAHRFILHQARQVSRSRTKLLVTALRSFLRFLFHRGDTTKDLAGALPSVANWRMSHLPKSLSTAEIEHLLASCDRQTQIGQRDYAILLLLARLGLRAGEIVAMTLNDIDWESGIFTIHGKGNKQEQLPLPTDVGEAFLEYLRHARSPCSSRRFFIRMHAPYRGFASSAAICNVVERALTRAGLNPDLKGAHLLRHSLATRMLNAGASLEEIGEILRHCHPQTTQIYAKVNVGALRALAPVWPSGVS